MKRKIIKIDVNRCTGCGDCISDCPEGAIQLIDGKARLISDLFCDGLGACIGSCPVDAITIEEREAYDYDEKKVMENIIEQGPNTIKAHLKHLKDHGQKQFLQEALSVLKEKGIDQPKESEGKKPFGGCPGMKTMDFSKLDEEVQGEDLEQPSRLRQWPLQLHLVSPLASYYQEKDVVLCADCVGYSLGNFHSVYLKGRSLAIACPKLDANQDIYLEKVRMLIDEAKINTLTVMTMEVPCCKGLLMLAQEAAGRASRKVPLKHVLVGIKGNIVKEEWI